MITVNIPETLNSFSSIYAPSRVKTPKGDNVRYRISVPAVRLEFERCYVKFNDQRTGESYDTPYVNASSEIPPTIMIGNGSRTDIDAWDLLCAKAMAWRIPRDVLLIGREVNVAVSVYRPIVTGAPLHDVVTLHAVQILGDLTNSKALNDRIDEIKGWFE